MGRWVDCKINALIVGIRTHSTPTFMPNCEGNKSTSK
jgi:hypothetical protein